MYLASLCLVLLVGSAECGRILALFPYPGYSHFAVFKPLLEELVRRGHHVTVVSHFPRQTRLDNYVDISIKNESFDYNNQIDLGHWEKNPAYFVTRVGQIYDFLDLYDDVFEFPGVKSLTEARQKYDVAIVEYFNSDFLLGLVHKLDLPLIGFTSCGLMAWAQDRVGNPSNPSYIPTLFSGVPTEMSFAQRLYNTVAHLYCKIFYAFFFDPYSQRLAEKHLGPLPPLSEIAKNTSLILVNSHYSIHKSRPTVPAVVEIAGITVSQTKPLPKDLQTLLDGSKNGVIYFSMGSMLRGETMPAGKRDAFNRVFSSLNLTVLWKWESDTMPGKADNVYISKWFPQRDILEHKNVRLFITHGGLLGVIEAVHCGVPTVTIPIFGDQEYNSEALVSQKVGLKLQFNSITEETIRRAVEAILYEPQYKENAARLSRVFRDRPMSPMDTAVYWVEHVIRHKGAPHLRSAAVDLKWYQLELLDVYLFIVGTLVGILMVIKFICTRLMRVLFKKTSKKQKSQ